MTPRARRPLVSPGRAADLLESVHGALDGGPAVLVAHGSAETAEPPAALPDVPAEVAVVVTTSGSTGAPRHVMLDAAALRASADATRERLGGPGQWLLALPTSHVAGLQVLVRSVLDGTTPAVVPPGPFRPASITRATASMGAAGARAATTDATGTGAARRYTSLVPTQLHRVLDGSPEARDAVAALRTFDAILVGGAALPAALADRARAAGLRIVTTYGMTETCGGCVYDGVPLRGVRVETAADGRLLIGGPVLARGYLDDRFHEDAAATDAAFVRRAGRRWLRTGDLGTVTSPSPTEPSPERPRPATPGPAAPGPAEQRVRVLGRADDMLISGGVNVSPAAVESALAGWDGLGEVCAVGVPDDEWGQAVAVVATVAPGRAAPGLAAVRERVAGLLGRAAAPRSVVVVPALPLRGPGKVDRREATRLATDAARGSAPRTTPDVG